MGKLRKEEKRKKCTDLIVVLEDLSLHELLKIVHERGGSVGPRVWG